MSENLVLTFQTQLSGVMETVLKSAIYEITRLVEDGFLEEVSRSREQVESLKKRLQRSENRGRERDREGGQRGKCAGCGRADEEGGSSGNSPTGAERGRGLKQEKVLGEEWSSCGGVAGETAFNDLEEAEATSPRRISESTEVGGQKLDSLLKEEPLHNTELRERWEFCLDGADGSDVSGPSKSFSEQALQQCQADWGPVLDQGPKPPGPEGDAGDPTDPLYRPRYSMKELVGGFEKSGCDGSGGGSDLVDIEGLDRFPGSPSRLGALSYGAVGHYQVDLGGSEGGDHHHRSNMPRPHQSRREQVGSPTPSPHPEVVDRNCLLINEEGYLQDSSVLYPEHGVAESGNRAGHRVLTSIHSGNSVQNNNTTESLYGAADDFGHSLNLRDRSQEHIKGGGGGGRCHACNQCTKTFPDSVSLKAHKQKHEMGRGLSTGSGSGPPYSRTQCGKVFTQACNLKVHQRVHQAEGLHLCSQCGKGFTSFSDLKRHKCSQTTDKPYCCSICGNKFNRLWNLKLHQRIHTQEKPHRCTMCDKRFTRADNLKVHQRIHTGERPYCCAVCGLRFKQLDHLKSHQRKHRPDLLK